ncbi:LolA-like outer membrane lipoprotein chaperone [Helicobacter mesocricetorum]|uniref:LolA-like outer membrane lipoprotein chaperone n=1 Tax=Helicobacter mesocricetorum TaxID=87012 RepID=UPI0013150AD1|nr:LolA-like outer membrane lipoprotein chaperone [Helicobacter mesocricetorum]
MKKFFLFLCFLKALSFGITLNEIQSFEAQFTQTLTSQNEQILYEGEIYIQTPNNVLWKYTKPIPKDVYIQDTTSIIYEPKLQQAIITNIQENLNILSLLQKAKKIDKNTYEAKIAGVVYTILTQEGIPMEVTFIDALENKIHIVFKNIKLNALKNENIFDFNPSSEVDILYH